MNSSRTRGYSQKTVKVLFARSGNQCAHPQCTNKVIEPATELSDLYVSGQICHIHAISPDGPRSKPGLTQEALNAPENLILLCPYHHGIIDGQHESYPAEKLKEWKRVHEAKMDKHREVDLDALPTRDILHARFPTVLVDKKIAEELERLCRTRFFSEVDSINNALVLGRKLVEGELSGGTDEQRSSALAWCARMLAPDETIDKAEEYLEHAKSLSACTEINIAEAFLISFKGDKEAALKILASIDLPLALSAALIIVAHHDGAKGAIVWLKAAGINCDALDSEGKFFLLHQQLELALWDAAEDTLGTLSKKDLVNTPALHHTAAITCLLRAVPVGFRYYMVRQLPLDPAKFPLASDARSMESREEAYIRFSEAAEVARQLNCPRIASLNDQYAFWLELKNPSTAELGRNKLEERLRDPKSALQLVPLGLHFGIKLDLKIVEQEIEQNIALHGGITPEAANARISLAFLQGSQKSFAGYIELHYNELSKFFDEKWLGALKIEAYSGAGMQDKAEQCLTHLIEGGLSDEEETRLKNLISESSGADPIELRKKQFEQTNSVTDLVVLVDQLQAQQNWQEICKFGALLFQKTHSIEDAERLATALTETHSNNALVKLLKPLPELREQSNLLQMTYCWALYNEGQLLEARLELSKTDNVSEDQNYRALTVNLGIATGDWPSLSEYVASEYRKKDNRSALELIQTAQLAHHLNSPRAKDLTYAAVDNGRENPNVLAAAYNLASTGGWEDTEAVAQWLQQAAELSGDQGPIQRMTLKDLVDQKPEWDRRETEFLQKLDQGEYPLFLAGSTLNKTLVNFILFPALANLSEKDPRFRIGVPAYSGQRQHLQFDIAAATVGIDATALLTLSFLDLLEVVLDAFDVLYIPHSTLFWLFEEKQRAGFHQPSRIRDAQQLRDMLATNSLEILPSQPMADSELLAQVGEGLASLIFEAEKVREGEETQRIVVRSSPVHRRGSLMDEEADLTKHTGVITSCLAVVEKLRKNGHITADEEKKARAYLQLHEKPWPQQSRISDGAVLYLDELSIDYFLHLGILGKLKAAGFTAVASPSEVAKSNALISYGSIGDKVTEVIERIRKALHSRIETGKIRIGAQCKQEQSDKPSVGNHPTVSVLALAKDCDAVIIDDRFLNQHSYTNEEDAKATILSTLDVLEGLVSTGSITTDQKIEYRTKLRRAGYYFIPLCVDETMQNLDACTVVDGKLIETAELKAIRENILCARMNNWLQLPKEGLWLDSTIKAFILVLRNIWESGDCLHRSKAISDWIVRQIDLRGWVHRLTPDIADEIVKTGRGAYILLLLRAPLSASESVMEAYWEWLEDRVLIQIKEQFPELFKWIVLRSKEHISDLANTDLDQGDPI